MKRGRPRIPSAVVFLFLLAPPGRGAPLDPCQFPVPEGFAGRLPANRYQCAMSEFLDTKCQEAAADTASALDRVEELRCKSDRNCVKSGEGLYVTFLRDGTGRVSISDTFNNTNTAPTSCELLSPPVDCAGLKEKWRVQTAARLPRRPPGQAQEDAADPGGGDAGESRTPAAASRNPLSAGQGAPAARSAAMPPATQDAAAAAAGVVVSAQFQGKAAVSAESAPQPGKPRPASGAIEAFTGGAANAGDIGELSDVSHTFNSLQRGAGKIRAMTREATPRLNDNTSRPNAPDPVQAPSPR